MFNVTKNNTEIKVEVSLKKRKLAREPVVTIDTEKVLDFLLKEGYNLENYNLVNDVSCSNYEKPSAQSEATWVWKKQQAKKEVKNVTKTRTKRQPAATKEDKLLGTEDLE